MIIDIVLGKAEGRGGLEDVITLVAQELNRRGHRIRVFQAVPPVYPEWAETLPEIHYYDPVAHGESPYYQEEIDFFRYSLGYRAMMETLGIPDVILATHVPLFSLVARMAISHLRERRPVLLSWMHGSLNMFNGTEVLLHYCDGHLALSKGMEQAIKDTLGQAAAIYLLGNPVKTDVAEIVPRPQKGLEIIYIGRVENQQKRIDVLLQALCQVQGAWHLTVVGDGTDVDELKKLAAALGVAGRITWKGWRKDPWTVVKKASILVLPSQNEPFGVVLVEALSRGIPVLASRCEGPLDIVQNEGNGWLFDVGNVGQLRDLLQDLINGTLELPAQETCKKSSERFKVDKIIDELEKTMTLSTSKSAHRGDSIVGINH